MAFLSKKKFGANDYILFYEIVLKLNILNYSWESRICDISPYMWYLSSPGKHLWSYLDIRISNAFYLQLCYVAELLLSIGYCFKSAVFIFSRMSSSKQCKHYNKCFYLVINISKKYVDVSDKDWHVYLQFWNSLLSKVSEASNHLLPTKSKYK